MARVVPAGWACIERMMASRGWRIQVFANPNVGGFTARMTDAAGTWLVPRDDSWWGHGPTAVDALQALAAVALAAHEPEIPA